MASENKKRKEKNSNSNHGFALKEKLMKLKRALYKDMKHIKTKKELEMEALLLYGGNNKQNPPFNVGDKLKQIWRVDDNNNLIKDGREMVEFVGMKGDMMLLKTLNSYAAHSEDTINPEVVKMSKKAGYKPIIGDVLQLHYMYADRYEVVG